jgi:hypothetical protein
MRESFDHCPAGWIRQSGKRCVQVIHNRMVVDYLAMSSVNFAMPDFFILISKVPSVGLQFAGRASERRARPRFLAVRMINLRCLISGWPRRRTG